MQNLYSGDACDASLHYYSLRKLSTGLASAALTD
ncbi:YSIRK-type signal peptide-containing protein [Mucilaginibacter rubeus]